MPLLVARRWPVVTRFSAALASWCPAQRFYAAPPPSTSGFRDGARGKSINGGIIIPDSVQTHPHQLFESIKPLSPLHALKRNFAVFFVTPSYAHFLLDDDAFLRTALQRIYKEAIETPDLTINALCAVVDKLPVPQPWNNQTLESQLSLRKRSSPVAGTGFEGIAYISLPPRASVPSNDSPLLSEHGAIDFITADYVSKDEICLDTLRLPLANTVFQTGMPTTMFHSSWKTDGKTGELIQVAKTTPSRHAIRLVDGNNALDLESALSIPLLPLTLPRVVEGCMGNIIRRVVDADGKSIQASSELENVVPRFFSSRNQPAQATVAWALVIPKDLKRTITTRTEELLANLPAEEGSNSTGPEHAWERLWRSDPPVWNTLISQALSEGARLHRVLSGGGGWGKKAGLLSLDPVPANKSSESSTSSEFLATIDDPGNFESTLTPVVQDGDSIQFFTLPKSDLAQEARESDNYETVSKLMDAKISEGWELGTIPSTMDSIPGESWQHMVTENHRSAFFQGSFGALTEGALTITRRRRNDLDRTSSAYMTTLDVPFSRFWAINPAQSDSITRHEDIDHFGKDKESVPNLNKLQSSLFNHVSNSSPRHTGNARVNPPLNYMQTGRFQHLLTAYGLMPTCKFSSTALAQGPGSESAALDSKSLTADVERSQSTNQKPQLRESHRESNDSSTGAKSFQNSAPKMTIPQLIRALGVTGVHMSGRLRARTARIMMYEIRRRFNETKFEYGVITSGRYRQRSRGANFRSAQVKPELGNTNKGKSIARRVPLEKKGDFQKEQRDARNGIDTAKRRKDNIHGNTQNNRIANPEKKKTQTPPIRKLSIIPRRTPEALNKTLRILVLEASHLADEAGAIMVAIRSRQRRTAPQSQGRSSTRPRRFLGGRRISQPRPLAPNHPRKETAYHTGTRSPPSRRNPKTQYRPRVRRVRARPRVMIKLHPSFSLGTIRFPDGRRAKLKQRSSPRYLVRSSSGQSRVVERSSVMRRVPVDNTEAVQRKREGARLWRKREREARKLAETVESWLGGGGGTGSQGGGM